MIHSARAKRTGKIAKSDAWRHLLWAARSCFTREANTKQAGVSEPCQTSGSIFAGAHCTEPLIASHARWDCASAWPSFAKQPIAAEATKHGNHGGCARRGERRWARGKPRPALVVPDGIGATTGLGYSINDAALHFRPGGT